jgi:hypothetical protein
MSLLERPRELADALLGLIRTLPAMNAQAALTK